MSRRKKGRNIHGWMIVDKPAGLTSSAVVNKVRWALDAKKAGHAGTLDPAATGVLAIAFGEATKTIPYIMDALKTYEFIVNWGSATNTDDAEGEVIATSTQRPAADQVAAALDAFRGMIQQTPPQVSAVKIDGERAYKRVRDGEVVEIAPRPLFVAELEILEQISPDQTKLTMTCGKGGYVRSIARDLGQALGCLGHVEVLRRTLSGPFDVATGVDPDAVEALARKPELDDLLLPLELGLSSLPECRCHPTVATALSNGNAVGVMETDAEEGDTAWASIDGQARAIGTYRAGYLHPDRVLVLDAD